MGFFPQLQYLKYLEEGIFCLAVSWIKKWILLVEFASWRRQLSCVCELASCVLHHCSRCSLVVYGEYTETVASGDVWSCPAGAVNACFALTYKAKTLGEPHCGGLFCLEWHRYSWIHFGAKYGLVFFYTTVKLFATGGYGWSKVQLR